MYHQSQFQMPRFDGTANGIVSRTDYRTLTVCPHSSVAMHLNLPQFIARSVLPKSYLAFWRS
jgi:hypothetical protein